MCPGATFHLGNGVDMRTMLMIASIAAGVALTVTVQRWTPYAMYWLFGNGK